jgi:hypothetical protein
MFELVAVKWNRMVVGNASGFATIDAATEYAKTWEIADGAGVVVAVVVRRDN